MAHTISQVLDARADGLTTRKSNDTAANDDACFYYEDGISFFSLNLVLCWPVSP